MKNLLDTLAGFLRLQKPVIFRVTDSMESGNLGEYVALWHGDTLVGHSVYIVRRSIYRPADSLIAHELIHAWQQEMELEEMHGPHFQEMAARIQHRFGIHNIYMKGTDE